MVSRVMHATIGTRAYQFGYNNESNGDYSIGLGSNSFQLFEGVIMDSGSSGGYGLIRRVLSPSP